MGAGLALAAYVVAEQRGLREHAPMRLYVYMALRALDGDAAPAYFGGRERLADALGAPRTASGFKLVRQAVSVLTDRGYLALDRHPAPGVSARYRLRDGAGSPLTPQRPDGAPSDSSDERTAHPQSAVNNSEQGTLSTPTAHPQGAQQGTLRLPQRRREDHEEELAAPPARTCDMHPNGTTVACGPCGRARRAREEYDAAEAKRPKPIRPHEHGWTVDGTCFTLDGGQPCLARREEASA